MRCNDYIILGVGIKDENKLIIKLALNIEGRSHIIAKQYPYNLDEQRKTNHLHPLAIH
jgi:hypothetical protein